MTLNSLDCGCNKDHGYKQGLTSQHQSLGCCLMHPAQAAQFALAHDQHISWKLCSRVVGRCWRDSQAPRGCHLGSHGSMAQWFPSQVTGQVGGKARCLGNSTQCQVCWFCIHQLGWKSLVCGGNDDLPDYQPKLCQLSVKSSWCLEKTWLSSVCLSKMELWHRAVKPRYRICECCGPLRTQASCWVQDTCLQSDGEGNADPLCWESRLKHLYHVLLWRKLIERIHIFDFLPDKHKEPTVLTHLCVLQPCFVFHAWIRLGNVQVRLTELPVRVQAFCWDRRMP